MLDAARDARSFAEGRSRADLDSDRMLSFALVRALEIISEAANNVSAQGRAGLPAIPWADIVGLRHRVVHAYFNVDLDVVWQSVQVDVPALIGELERSVPSPPPE
jgi:uncharacterized protein with HEPN domain